MLGAAAARAEVRLEVGGRVEEREERLAVTLTLHNAGDTPAGPVDIEGELLGHYEEERLDPGPPAGGRSEITLYYPLTEAPRPGVHPLALHLRFTPNLPGAVAVNQRAYLLLALGANPEPAVRLFVSPARFETLGGLQVGLESADGQPHRVWLRVLTPRGINPLGEPPELDLPAAGRVIARVELLRGTATRPSRHGIVVLAGIKDGPLERTSAALGEVEVLPDSARMPKLRWPLAAVAVALLAALAPAMSDEVIRHYTEAMDEDGRLQQGMGRFEYERTTELIHRYLGPPPQVVVDVGGGTGAYALWLAGKGHEVHLVDLVPRHVEAVQAKAQGAPRRLGSAQVGDARSLPFAASRADLVLLLGPLYHLTEPADRIQALREAGRVVRPEGRVLCGAISRFASMVAGFRDDRFRSPEFEAMTDRDLRDGQHRNPIAGSPHLGTAFLHRPADLRAEIEQAGLRCETILGVETLAALVGRLETWRRDDRRLYELTHKYARAVEEEAELLGASLHLLGVARHPGPAPGRPSSHAPR